MGFASHSTRPPQTGESGGDQYGGPGRNPPPVSGGEGSGTESSGAHATHSNKGGFGQSFGGAVEGGQYSSTGKEEGGANATHENKSSFGGAIGGTEYYDKDPEE